MHKKLFAIFILSLLFISIGCTRTPNHDSEMTLDNNSPAFLNQENVKSTGEEQVDNFGNDLSDVNTAQNELDDKGLNDVDSSINDIEKV